MGRSVKMRDEDKARLDRLQAEITRRTGRKVNQQDLLGQLVRRGEMELLDTWRPSQDDQDAMQTFLDSLPHATRKRFREEDIDRDLADAA